MNSILKKIVWLIMIAPAAYLAIVWKNLPEKIAIHSNLKGDQIRMGDKSELITAALILIAVNALVYLLLINIYRIDPKKFAADNRSRLQKIAFAVALFLSLVLCFVIYGSTTGNMKLTSSMILAALGLLFSIIGNYLPNLKPNYFAGLRLPWTLENEENWKKTHALAGKLWFAGGIIIAAVCLFTGPVFAYSFFFSIMMIITLIPCIYSYRIYSRQKKNL